MTTQLSTTDYSNIAKQILANIPDESKAFEVEVSVGELTVFVEVDYDVEYREVIGGSYEGWDFERLSEIAYERIEVLNAEIYDNEGETAGIEVCASTIEKLLN